jgi:hypothetical protein
MNDPITIAIGVALGMVLFNLLTSLAQLVLILWITR